MVSGNVSATPQLNIIISLCKVLLAQSLHVLLSVDTSHTTKNMFVISAVWGCPIVFDTIKLSLSIDIVIQYSKLLIHALGHL